MVVLSQPLWVLASPTGFIPMFGVKCDLPVSAHGGDGPSRSEGVWVSARRWEDKICCWSSEGREISSKIGEDHKSRDKEG